jgi:phage baseplate assembly protein V
MMEQIKSWVSNYIRSVLESVIRVAVVSSTDPTTATVRVTVPDGDDLVSHDLRVLVRKVHQDKDYWMPDVDDQVLCIFLPFGLEQGFVVGSFYSIADPVPVQTQDKRHVAFADGTTVEYDRAAHHLDVKINGTITIHADGAIVIDSGDSVTVTAPRIDLN